ncbi:MAG: carboxylesterase family protein [Myxococcaceae bacterium]|nr:carboxylesterase family protein [Myxococcaceae bacterium]
MRLLWLVGCVAFGVGCGTPPSAVDGGGSGGGSAGELDAGADAGIDCNAGAQAANDVVFTERGPVRGEVTPGGRAFRGLPFVKPPTGALRWRPPEEERACWAGTRDALQFGPQCPQLEQAQGQPFDAGAPVFGDEDCLTLNVFTPASASPDAGLPVMVFIHGGGNTLGSAREPIGNTSTILYDGTRLAQAGNVVVVTMQYRIGVLGYLSMPSLDAETDGGVSGNYGLMDQQAALRWVKRNVAGFGGDPSRVLLFGESAGALNTCTHLAMPGSAGLFQRAIVQSGSCGAALTPDVRRMESSTWLGGTGCAAAADIAACLRALTPEQAIRAYPVPVVVGGRRPSVSWGPVIDGRVLPELPYEAMRNARHHRVPVMIGSNLDETNLSMPLITTEQEYRAAVTALIGPVLADRVTQQLYPSATYGTPRRALVQATTDGFFGCQARIASRAAALGNTGGPVYRYLFARAAQPLRGAFHGVELVYVFQKVSEAVANPNPADTAVEASMLGWWTRFAATGDPNGVGSVSWPRYSSTEPLLRIDATPMTVSGWRTAECDFWDMVTSTNVPAPP